MNATVVIARRELVEKRFVLLAAIAFAALAFVVPLVPGVHVGQKREAIVIVSTVLAVGFTLGLSTILGVTIIGRDLSEGRLSFYFTRPVPATAIWFGKLIAALILITICFGIVVAPAALLGLRAFPGWTGDPNVFPAVVLIASVALLLLGHGVGTVVRSRTAWIAADFVCAAIIGGATYGLSRTLLDGFAVELTNRFLELLSAFAVVAMVTAGAWQLARGRTDRRRSHLQFSLALWSLLGVAILIGGAFVWWVASVRPGDLIAETGLQESAGPWSYLAGGARNRGDYRAAFLYNIDNGQFLRLPADHMWVAPVLFSSDGRVAVLMNLVRDFTREVYVTHLDSRRPRPIETGIISDPYAEQLSPDGSRLALIDRGRILTIYDLASRRSLGSARAPAGPNWAMTLAFVSSDTLRIYVRDQQHATLRISEYSLATKAVRETGQIATPRYGMVQFTEHQERALIRSQQGDSLELRDGRSGSLLTTLAPHAGARFGNAGFLRDGRIVASEIGTNSAMVRLFGPDGAGVRDISLRDMDNAYVRAATPDGRIIMTARRSQQGWFAVVVDLNRGAILRVDRGLEPLSYGSARSGALLCMTTSKELVAWDPRSGAKRAINR
jgi:ABC-type transport system involved in multi-copper enzyme maturation permease subunit